MALSSQGGLDFGQSRLQNPAQSVSGSLSEFGSLFKQFQDNKIKADLIEEEKRQRAIENARADRAEAIQKEQFEMRKKEFDTAQNTLRATTQGATVLDKAAVGQALLDKQAATIGGSDGNGNFQNKLLQESQALAAKYQPVTNADGTSTSVEMSDKDAARFKAIQDQLGNQADKMLAANKGNMQTQKQLIGEVGNQYFKEGQDGPMLYDPTSLNKYKQDLLSGLDTRIHQKDVLDQNAAQHAASLAQSERHYRQSRADAKNAQSAAEQREAARLEAFGKSLIPAEKQTHKVYTKEFGEKILKPLQKLEEIKAKRESEAISDFSKDPIFKRSGLSIVNVNGKPTIVNPGGRPVNDYYVSEQQKKLDDTVFKKVAPDTGNGTLYTRIANLRKVALDADNPVHQKAYGYKFTGRKVGSDSLDNLVKLPGGNYKSDKPDYVKDPNAYSMLMTQMAINGIDQFGNPASADDITMARLWLLNEQQANVESSRELGRSNVKTVNTGLKPPKQTASND